MPTDLPSIPLHREVIDIQSPSYYPAVNHVRRKTETTQRLAILHMAHVSHRHLIARGCQRGVCQLCGQPVVGATVVSSMWWSDMREREVEQLRRYKERWNWRPEGEEK